MTQQLKSPEELGLYALCVKPTRTRVSKKLLEHTPPLRRTAIHNLYYKTIPMIHQEDTQLMVESSLYPKLSRRKKQTGFVKMVLTSELIATRIKDVSIYSTRERF